MAKDYKHRATPRHRRPAVPGWLWLLAGLALGLLVAFLGYLQQSPRAPADAPQPGPARPLSGQEARDVKKTTPAPVPPPPKPRYDFYTILPGMEVVVPEQSLPEKTREGVRPVEAPGTYVLQAGSFRSHPQADQLKARLALLGLKSEIQVVTIDNRETWHRVRVGPFKDLNALNAARARLKENRLDAILLRVSE
ncbi:MAG: SPOR domain-containing protein [Gammaproteobacteria bacterium]